MDIWANFSLINKWDTNQWKITFIITINAINVDEQVQSNIDEQDFGTKTMMH